MYFTIYMTWMYVTTITFTHMVIWYTLIYRFRFSLVILRAIPRYTESQLLILNQTVQIKDLILFYNIMSIVVLKSDSYDQLLRAIVFTAGNPVHYYTLLIIMHKPLFKKKWLIRFKKSLIHKHKAFKISTKLATVPPNT
jgi:hypothetical protein